MQQLMVATDEPLAFVGSVLRHGPQVGDEDEGDWRAGRRAEAVAADAVDDVGRDRSNSPPELLDALVISDLHLGAENCQARPLVELMQRILDGEVCTRRLIINGDVFDSIDFRRLKKSHWKVLSQIRHLSDKIEVVWIAGNHDGPAEIVSHLLGVSVCEEYTFVSAGQRILCVHGHAFDDFIGDHPFLTWLADCAYLLLQRLDRTHYVARLAKRKSKIFVRCVEKIERGAVALAREKGCQAVLCGHTHHACRANIGGVTYVNSGCWTEKPSTYLEVVAGEIRLRTWAPAEDDMAPVDAAAGRAAAHATAAAAKAESPIATES